jgi:ligand-binding sensor domain-containing protein
VPTETPPTPAAVAAAEIGSGTLLALGAGDGRVSVLQNDAWLTPQMTDRLAACLATGSTFIDSQGVLWAGCTDLLRSTDGGATWALAPGERIFGSRSLIDATGQIWWLAQEQITVINAADARVVATYVAADVTGEDGFPTETAAFAADGTLWLGGLNISGSELVSFDGSTWTAYGENEALGVQSFESPAAVLGLTDGRVLVATSSNLYTFEDGALVPQVPTSISFDFPSTVTSMVELPDGTIALGSFEGLTVWDGATLTQSGRDQGLPADKINDLVVDASGRLWVATDAGIAVQDGTGGWQAATSATSGLNDSRIVALAVTGAPALPPPSETVRTAEVRGRIVADGSPVAGTSVLLCSESPKSFFDESPCEAMAVALAATTDADGNFTLADVPIGTFSLAVQRADGQWVSFIGDIPVLDAGELVSLGDIDVN